ncbi:hypothetical protein TNCV_4717221 [Trichonephila clavipes]|nr:hypothetical protein TNCV_4717221 [Trichonephila clavipes]
MLQHQGEDPTGKPEHPLSAALTLQQCLFGDSEERYHQPIDRSGLTPASRLQRSVGQRRCSLHITIPEHKTIFVAFTNNTIFLDSPNLKNSRIQILS